MTATESIASADDLAVAAIAWFELAGLAEHDRIVITSPGRSWLDRIAVNLRSAPIGLAVAAAGVSGWPQGCSSGSGGGVADCRARSVPGGRLLRQQLPVFVAKHPVTKRASLDRARTAPALMTRRGRSGCQPSELSTCS
jgi:hypothetical protein